MGDDDEPAAVQQGAPDLPHREVEGVGVEQRPHVVLAEVEVLGCGGEEADDARVYDGDALGAAGGAGCVDDVRDVRRARRAPPVGVGQPSGGPAREVRLDGGVVQDDGGDATGEVSGETGLGDKEGGGHIVHDQPQAFRGVAAVQGEVGGSGLEDREQGGQQPQASGQGQRHHPARARTPLGQQPCQAVGAGVELRVGEPFALVGDSDALRPGPDLPLEQLGEGGGDREVPHRSVTRVLTGQQQLQARHGCRGRGLGQSAQESQETVAVQAEFVLVVQCGVGVEGQPQAAGAGARSYRDLEVVDGATGEWCQVAGLPPKSSDSANGTMFSTGPYKRRPVPSAFRSRRMNSLRYRWCRRNRVSSPATVRTRSATAVPAPAATRRGRTSEAVPGVRRAALPSRLIVAMPSTRSSAPVIRCR